MPVLISGWQEPSLKKLGKLPCIELAGEGTVEEIKGWLKEHPEISRCVPPLYPDFVLRYKVRINSKLHEYVDIVHYSEDLTVFAVVHCIDGKKVLRADVDYNGVEGDRVPIYGTYPASSPYKDEWLQYETTATVPAVLAVQAYLLYHRPDVIPQVIDRPAPKPRKVPRKPEYKQSDRTVAPTVRRIIRITPEELREPKPKKYRAISWQVRGHYRRITGRDGEQRLVYIRPHTACRGKRKLAPGTIKIKGE